MVKPYIVFCLYHVICVLPKLQILKFFIKKKLKLNISSLGPSINSLVKFKEQKEILTSGRPKI